MNGTELLRRVALLGLLRKRFKSIQKIYVSYIYYRELQKRKKWENLWKMTKKKSPFK